MTFHGLFACLISTRDESKWLAIFCQSRPHGITGTEICDHALAIGLIRGDEMQGESEIADAVTRLCHLWDEWTELAETLGNVPGSG